MSQPIVLRSPPTGETFHFHTSARGGDGRFRFTWTLAPGQSGPSEHTHTRETEHFRMVSGELQVWLAGERSALYPGDQLAIPPGVPHRFHNAGATPAVTECTLDGTALEDQFVPIAVRFPDGEKFPVTGVPVLIVHGYASMLQGSAVPTSRAERSVIGALAALFRFFGLRALPPVSGWDGRAPG
ncbi:MAG: cupin domain-containing protein [Myxococcota bacterium]